MVNDRFFVTRSLLEKRFFGAYLWERVENLQRDVSCEEERRISPSNIGRNQPIFLLTGNRAARHLFAPPATQQRILEPGNSYLGLRTIGGHDGYRIEPIDPFPITLPAEIHLIDSVLGYFRGSYLNISLKRRLWQDTDDLCPIGGWKIVTERHRSSGELHSETIFKLVWESKNGVS